MRKTLLFILVALLMPVFALAQNMGVTKTVTTYTGSSPQDSHIYVPASAVGMSLPSEGNESYSIGIWVNVSANFYMSTLATKHPGMSLMNLYSENEVNDAGPWAVKLVRVNPTNKTTANLSVSGERSGGHEINTLGASTSTLAEFTLNEWHYVMITLDNDNQKFCVYLDGKQVGDFALSGKAYYPWGDGVFHLFGMGCSGTLDEANFYNKALSVEEAAVSYANASSVSGLTAQYTFDKVKEGTTGTFTNQVSVGEISGVDAKWITFTSSHQIWDTDVMSNRESNPYAESAPTLAEGRESFCTLTLDVPEGVTATIAKGTSVVTDLSAIAAGKEYYATFSVPEGKCISAVKIGETVLTEQGGKYPFTLDGDATLTVELADARTFTVNIVQPANGTITVSKPNATGSLTAIASGATLYEGTVLTLSNTPNAGYSLVNYTINGAEYNTSAYTLTGDVTISGVFDEHIDYCTPTSVNGATSTTTSSGRALTALKISKGDDSEVETVSVHSSGTRAVYVDCSETAIIECNPGQTLSVTTEGIGEWMHQIVFFDKDRNGLDNNDLIFHNWTYKEGSTTEAAHKDIPGVTYTIDIPADLAPGKYRVRHIQNWNVDQGPCTYGQSNTDNGEAVVDFTLKVVSNDLETPRRVTVVTENADYGTVAITNPATEESSVETVQANVTIAATPAEGYAFMNWTDADGNVVSTNAVYTYTGTTDATFTANFGVEITYSAGEGGSLEVTVDGQAVANGSILPVGTEVVVVATPATDYRLVAISVNGEAQEGDEVTFTADKSVEITATFTDAAYTFTINKTGNGEVAALIVDEDGNIAPIANGAGIKDASDIYLKILPDEGYTIASLNIAHVGNFNTTDGVINLDNYMSDKVYDSEAMESEGYPGYNYWISTSGDVVVTVVFAPDNVEAIDGIYADGFDENAPVEYYNLQGVRVAAENLAPGFYIARQGAKAKKVLVTK